MSVNSIVFDMDGVLIDSERLVLRAWQETAQNFGLPDVGAVFPQCLGVTHAKTAELFRAYCGNAMEYEAFRNAVRERYLEYTKDGVPTKPGAPELLAWLQEQGWSIGLASSTREESVRRSLGSTGFLPFFRALVCGDMLPVSKPAPDIYLRACAELAAPPEETFAVEDSLNGLLSASRAGMKVLLVPDLMAPNEEMRALALRIFPDLWAVREYLERG